MCEIYRISIDLLQNSYTFLDMAIKQVDFYMVSDYNYIIVNTIKYMSFNQKDYSVKSKNCLRLSLIYRLIILKKVMPMGIGIRDSPNKFIR